MSKIHWPMLAIAVLFVAAVATLDHTTGKRKVNKSVVQGNRIWIKE